MDDVLESVAEVERRVDPQNRFEDVGDPIEVIGVNELDQSSLAEENLQEQGEQHDSVAILRARFVVGDARALESVGAYQPEGHTVEAADEGVEAEPEDEEGSVDEDTELADIGQADQKGREEGVENEHENDP